MSPRRWWLGLPLLPALVPGWLLALAGFALLLSIAPRLSAGELSGGLVFAAGLGGALTAALLRPGQGRPLYRVSRLFLAAAAVSLGVWLAALLVDLAAGGAFIRVSTLGAWIASLIVLCSGPGFLVLRAALDLVLWWNALRRRRYLWSLTHLFLLAALSVAFIFMLLGVALVSSTVLTNPQSEAPFLVRLLLQIAPLSLVFFAALVAGLLLILPPSLLVAWWVARGQTRRIEALASAAAALRAGDLGARVSVSGADELAQLQADFNAMSDHLQSSTAALQAERDRVTGLLKAQRELTAGVSHELRTPVTTLGGLLEAALESPSSALPSGLRTDLEIMRAEVQRLQVLIEDLFALSRAEVNQLSLRCERFDAAPVLAAVAASAAPLAWRAARVTVSADAPAGLPLIFADPARLDQVLRNLVQNAVRHTPPGGVVLLRAGPDGAMLRLDVCDSGPGIDPAERERIFERFYQCAGDRSAGSSGLGLALVRELTLAMRGRVDVSAAPGEGCCFSVWLPLDPAP